MAPGDRGRARPASARAGRAIWSSSRRATSRRSPPRSVEIEGELPRRRDQHGRPSIMCPAARRGAAACSSAQEPRGVAELRALGYPGSLSGEAMCPRSRNLRRPDRHDPPLRRRAAAAARGEGRRGGRGPRRDRPRDAGDGAVRPLHPGGIWRARPHHGRGGAGRARIRADDAGLPLGVRHQCRHRQPGPRHGRHATRRRREWLPRHRQRRDHHQLRPDRAGRRLGQRLGADPRGPRRRRLQAHAAPSASSPMPTRPASSRSWRGPAGRARRASRPSSCPPICPASRSASPRRRWASRAPMSATSISTRRRCPPPTGSARKARASRSRCGCSTAAGCTSPRSASASPSG